MTDTGRVTLHVPTAIVPDTGPIAAMRSDSSHASRCESMPPFEKPAEKTRRSSTQYASSIASSIAPTKPTSSTSPVADEPQQVPAFQLLPSPCAYTTIAPWASVTGVIFVTVSI